MKILTTVKKVVDVELNIHVEDGVIVEDGLQYVINAWDENAVETAVQLKENNGAETTLVSIGGGDNTMVALSAKDGRTLWKAPHPQSGYKSPEDLFVIGDRVWTTTTTFGTLDGTTTGHDLKTGRASPTHRQDLGFYALVETLRTQIPPRKLASFYLDAGEPAARVVRDPALDRLTGTPRGRPGRRPGRQRRGDRKCVGATCRWCFSRWLRSAASGSSCGSLCWRCCPASRRFRRKPA